MKLLISTTVSIVGAAVTAASNGGNRVGNAADDTELTNNSPKSSLQHPQQLLGEDDPRILHHKSREDNIDVGLLKARKLGGDDEEPYVCKSSRKQCEDWWQANTITINDTAAPITHCEVVECCDNTTIYQDKVTCGDVLVAIQVENSANVTSDSTPGDVAIFCLTKEDCEEVSKFLGLDQSVYEGDYKTKGCFQKNDRVFFSNGTKEEMSIDKLPGNKKRVYCDSIGTTANETVMDEATAPSQTDDEPVPLFVIEQLWTVTKYLPYRSNDTEQELVEPISGTKITLTLDYLGYIRGDTGCNEYFGRFKALTSSSFTIDGSLVRTKMKCGDELDIQEQNYLSWWAPDITINWKFLDDGSLELSSDTDAFAYYKTVCLRQDGCIIGGADQPATTLSTTTTTTTIPTTQAPPTIANTADSSKGLTIGIVGSAWEISSWEEGMGANFYDAAEVTENTDDNNILNNLIFGFAELSTQIVLSGLEGKRKYRSLLRNVRGVPGGATTNERKTQQLTPVVVTDIACPDNVAYTVPAGMTCLNFHLTVDTGALPNETIEQFSSQVNLAINNGELYEDILEMFPTTNITGLGSPGKGYDYKTSSISGEELTVDKGYASPASTEEGGGSSSSGLPTVAIVFIILAVVFIPLTIIALYSRHRKKRQNEEGHFSFGSEQSL